MRNHQRQDKRGWYVFFYYSHDFHNFHHFNTMTWPMAYL
ncbi:hypothetical protein L581_0004 [Serratia fonticola AU-AP2C]|nr:hypothetical protein L581_0004 [Serratia fonticola AU-AP2C]